MFYSKQQGHVKQIIVCPTFTNWLKQRHQGKATEGPYEMDEKVKMFVKNES